MALFNLPHLRQARLKLHLYQYVNKFGKKKGAIIPASPGLLSGAPKREHLFRVLPYIVCTKFWHKLSILWVYIPSN